MIDNALVSVIMPCYRAVDTLSRAIRGVVSQIYQSWELLLVIDGTDFELEKLAREWGEMDSRIRVIVSSKNRGVSRSRNLGIRLSKGEYIAFCDADDFWYPNKLWEQLQVIKDKSADLICSAFYFVNPTNQNKKLVQTKNKIDRHTLLRTNPIPLSTAMFKRRILKNCYFPCLPKPYIHEDYAFWIILFKSNHIVAVNMRLPTTEIMMQIGSRSSNKIAAARSHGYILRHFAKKNGWIWLFYMVSYTWHGTFKRIPWLAYISRDYFTEVQFGNTLKNE